MTVTHVSLHTLTPVHIGGTEALHPSQFVVLGNRLYVLSEERFLTTLQQRNLAHRFLGDAAGILNNREGGGLRSWLQRYRLWDAHVLTNMCVYTCKLAGNPPTTSDIRALTRSAHGNPQFFGTSVKGSLRTVILYHLAKAWQSEKPAEFINMVEIALQRSEQNKKWASQQLVEKLLATFSLGQRDEQGAPYKSSGGSSDAPYRDYLRVLKVADAEPFAKEAASVVSTNVKSAKGSNDWYDKAPITVEAVDVGQRTHLKLVLDDWLMNQYANQHVPLPFTTPAELEQYVVDFHQDWLTYEAEFYHYVKKSFPSALLQTRGKPVLHLGWGSGLTGTTLLMLLPEAHRLKIRDGYFDKRDMSVFPKSRRLGPGDTPLGLVELAFSSEPSTV